MLVWTMAMPGCASVMDFGTAFVLHLAVTAQEAGHAHLTRSAWTASAIGDTDRTITRAAV
jgi:hypothetical protein